MGMSFPVDLDYPDGTGCQFIAPLQSTILVAALKNNVYIRHDCGGKAQCGTCRVTVFMGKVTGMSERERVLLERLNAKSGERLACQLYAMAPLKLHARFGRTKTVKN